MIAPSQPDDAVGCGTSPAPGCIKAIVGNPVMINAYKEGIPDNGKPFPEGAVIAKIEWRKSRNSASPYGVTVPGTLAEVSFIMKDLERFPNANGWGYATFTYDAASDTFKAAHSDNPAFGNICHGCHTLVKARDFIFTSYPKR